MGNIYLWPGFFWTLLNIAIFLGSKIQHSTSAGFNVQQSSKITSFTDLVEERGEKLWKPPFVEISNVFYLKYSWTWMNGCSSRMGTSSQRSSNVLVPMGAWSESWSESSNWNSSWRRTSSVLSLASKHLDPNPHHTLLPPQPKRKRDKEKSGW